MSEIKLVKSLDEVKKSLTIYAETLPLSKGLQERIKRHSAWYAVKGESGKWLFGPSKFIGYAENTAENYLREYSRLDGKDTEPTLRAWFEPVEEDTQFFQTLKLEFCKFAEAFGKTPKANWRVSIACDESFNNNAARRKIAADKVNYLERISIDADTCGGRPRIKNTRIRVCDILDMIANGASQDEILDDFNQLSREDILAAVKFASVTFNHPVLFAA